MLVAKVWLVIACSEQWCSWQRATLRGSSRLSSLAVLTTEMCCGRQNTIAVKSNCMTSTKHSMNSNSWASKHLTSACCSPLRGWDLRSAALHYGPKCGRYTEEGTAR